MFGAVGKGNAGGTSARSALRPACVAALLALLPASGASAAPAARAFDRELIHADYQAGDFDKVIRALELFLDSGRPCPRADSVFVAKHLAVVYAADPKTRERGRYHMLRMLALDPRADLLDMFVGEEVDGIFEKVRREAQVRRGGRVPAAAAAAADPRPASPPRASRTAAPRAAAPRAKAAVSPTHESRVRRLPPARPRGARLDPWSLDPVSAVPSAPAAPALARPSPGASRPTGPTATGSYAVPAAPGAPSAPLPVAPPSRGPTEAMRRALLDLDPAAPAPPPASAPTPAAPAPVPVLRPPPRRLPAARPEAAALSGTPAAEMPPAVPDSAAPRPRWKEKGFWIGGGAALAVVGITLYLAGEGPESGAKGRTYAVSAKPQP